MFCCFLLVCWVIVISSDIFYFYFLLFTDYVSIYFRQADLRRDCPLLFTEKATVFSKLHNPFWDDKITKKQKQSRQINPSGEEKITRRRSVFNLIWRKKYYWKQSRSPVKLIHLEKEKLLDNDNFFKLIEYKVGEYKITERNGSLVKFIYLVKKKLLERKLQFRHINSFGNGNITGIVTGVTLECHKKIFSYNFYLFTYSNFYFIYLRIVFILNFLKFFFTVMRSYYYSVSTYRKKPRI